MDISSILGATSRHFPELLEEDANPLVMALALMDSSSVGKAMHASEFDQLHDGLKQCLKNEVGQNIEGFNTSISLYHTLVNSVNANHQTAQSLQAQLAEIRRCVQDRNPIVKEWQDSSQRYKQDLELLDIAETLKGAPDKYEGFVSHKRFLEAHECLNSALDTILTSNMLQYPPIVPIHAYVVQQQMGLADTIEHEIASHLYLTSPYAITRVKSEGSMALKSFLDKLGEPLEIDLNALEADSFTYIRYLVEILGKIGRLDQVAENIVAKVAPNVRRLVEKTIEEYIKKQAIKLDTLAVLSPSIVEQLDNSKYKRNLRQLEGLVTTVYAKLGAVLEGHRVLYELIKMRVQYNILHVYAAVEIEVSSILSSYISAPPVPRGMGLRRKSFGEASKRSLPSKHLTKSEYGVGPQFELSSENLDPEMQAEFDQLRLAMKKWVPGLKLGELTGEPLAQEETLMVVSPASVLNIRALAGPTAQFLQTARDVLDEPQCTHRIQQFLPNFLTGTYLPSLKSAVERYVDEACENGEIYSDYKQVSQLPILSAAHRCVELVSRLSVVLNTNTYYRAEYVDVLLSAIEQFRDFVALRIKDGLGAKAIQQLCKSENMRALHQELYKSVANEGAGSAKGAAGADGAPPVPPTPAAPVLPREIEVYLKNMATAKSRLRLNDLLEIETFRLYTTLATTVKWVLTHLHKMSAKSEEKPSTPPSDSVALVRRSWALVEGGTGEARIVLAGESWDRFSEVMEHLAASNRQLLSLLRCDLMCRIVHHFDEMAQHNYEPENGSEDVDPEIELLQTNLSLCHKISETTMVPRDRAFVFAGCAKLMNELFVRESVNMGIINENGVRKMFSNILSLQQVLKSVVSLTQDVDFSRSVDFYESLRLTPMRAIDAVRSRKSRLLEEDLILVLQVKYKEEQARSRDHNSSLQQYNEQVQQVRRMFAKK